MAKPSVLPSGMKLVGDVAGEDDFVVFGVVEGEIRVDGSVVVEQSGLVRGNVSGRTVTVRGVVVGDASAGASIRVDEGGKMVGDVHAPRVNIVKGARFRGHVHMTGKDGVPVAPQTVAPDKRRRRRKRRSGAARPEGTEVVGNGNASHAFADTNGHSEVVASRTEHAPGTSTVPGSLRAAQKADTLVGDAAPAPRRPPPPRMPVLRRTRGRRK